MRTTRFFILALCVTIGIVVVYCLRERTEADSHPSTDALIDVFNRNRADFQSLYEMIHADAELRRVDGTSTSPEDVRTIGISEERVQEYRTIMSKVNISYGFIALRDPECFSFPVSAAGLGVSGSAKGIAYVEEEPALVVERLDDYWPVEEQSFTAYQHIDDNWYVFFDYEW